MQIIYSLIVSLLSENVSLNAVLLYKCSQYLGHLSVVTSHDFDSTVDLLFPNLLCLQLLSCPFAN